MRRLAIWIGVIAAGCHPEEGPPSTDGEVPRLESPDLAVAPAECEARRYFLAEAWPSVFQRCAGCHVPGGASGGTRFVLRPAGSAEDNFTIAAAAARTLIDADGKTSLFLLKPTGKLPHGGGVVIVPGAPEERVLEEAVRRFLDPAAMAGCASGGRSPTDGVLLMDARATLRKAALQIAGRPPTHAEYAAATGGPDGLDGLDPLLRGMMTEEGFRERLVEMWNDLLLTDRYRLESSFGHLSGVTVPRGIRVLPYCDSVNWQSYDERNPTMQSTVCIGAAEGLAREPVELIAHVVQSNRSFGEILTAQYRYLNVYAAMLHGLDLAPFQGHESDRGFFAEVKIPSVHAPGGMPAEYAGLLTTNAFMTRYYSTSSNRNRGRAHTFYKFFLDLDIMKSGTRLDLSTVDLAKSPWRHDAQCTGCHATIDPVAGAFQHWTDCYDNPEVRHFATRYCSRDGWFPDSDMHAPGVGPGDANRLAPGQIPTALSHLAASTVKNPAFARAVAAHVLGSLTGQERLSPPGDPAAPDYAPLTAAYEAQAKTIEALAQSFVASNLDFKKLVIATVKTPHFRARAADMEGRAELTGLGGGARTPPELLHRKLVATVGAPWTRPGGAADPRPSLRDPPHFLLSLQKFRLFAGGIDSDGVRQRSRLPGSLAASVDRRMALETSCACTAYDFALDRASRRLFPRVDRTLVPSGDAAAPDQKPILENLVFLHDRLWGETVTAGDPELLASYQLLADLRRQGAAAIAAGKTPATLVPECAAKTHHATGVNLPVNQQFNADNDYVVRAWQGLLTYMLIDHRFVSEP